MVAHCTVAAEVRCLQMLLTRLGRILNEQPPSGPRNEVVALVESLSRLEVQKRRCELLIQACWNPCLY